MLLDIMFPEILKYDKVLEFRRKFGQINQLIKQIKKVTEIASIRSNQRYIINKETFKQKPTYKTMFYAIRTFCEANNIN